MREPYTHTVLALLVVALFAVSYVLPFFVPVPEGEAGTLIVGTAKVIETVVVLVLGYYFGSSRGSARKDQILSDALNERRVLPAPDAFDIPSPSQKESSNA